MKTEETRVIHPIPPTYDSRSEILILGSFPSVKSRETEYFYGHPQNRFWKLMSALYSDALPETIEEKRAFLLKHRVAVWDVIRSCVIKGSSDSSIREVVPNDLNTILEKASIKTIYCNGTKAYQLYCEYIKNRTYDRVVCLPSTSPANAAWTLERLEEAWRNAGIGYSVIPKNSN